MNDNLNTNNNLSLVDHYDIYLHLRGIENELNHIKERLETSSNTDIGRLCVPLRSALDKIVIVKSKMLEVYKTEKAQYNG